MIASITNINASEISSEQTTDVVHVPMRPISSQVETSTVTDVITIPDVKLEQALSYELGVPVGEITVKDMESLTNLNLSAKRINDITGLEYATSLKELNLQGNQISDISPLSGLASLKELNLYGNQVSDISPLSGLTSLTYLDLFNNQVSDISPLSGLASLTYLLLSGNQISDISPLSGLTSLTYLLLSGNQISDISPLSGLTSLTDLDLQGNQISDISPLSGLTSLTGLQLSGNQISDISPLSGLTKLEWLLLYQNQISDISPLSGLTKLESLFLDQNQISDISPLGELTKLESLFLDQNQISDISPLGELTKLSNLMVDSQSIQLEDIVVTSDDEIFYLVTDIDGIEHQVSLGVPMYGVYEMTGDWSIDTISGIASYTFSGSIYQTVTYRDVSNLTGSKTADITEETRLFDEQLVSLFEVVNSDGLAISVDQSSIDYSTPGEYQVIFTDTDGNEFTGILTITDVLPTLDIDKDTVSISKGSSIDDILSQVTLNATEITSGDLTGIISIDDSSVDYSTPGDYHVIFTVVDEEGNSVSKTVTITIIEENVETVDPKIPDGVEEVNSVEKNEKTISEETTSRMAEDETISNDENVQMTLLTTGDKIVGTIIVLLTVVIIAFGLKIHIRVK